MKKEQNMVSGTVGNSQKSKLKIIPLGGLEQIGMNITAFEYEDSIVVVDFRQMICWVLIWLFRMSHT